MFANELNAYKACELTTANNEIALDLQKYQQEVHTWSKPTRSASTSKESMHILALTGGECETFRLLGVHFDNALRMNDAVTEIVASAI